MKSINIVECKNEDDLKEVAILAKRFGMNFFLESFQKHRLIIWLNSFKALMHARPSQTSTVSLS